MFRNPRFKWRLWVILTSGICLLGCGGERQEPTGSYEQIASAQQDKINSQNNSSFPPSGGATIAVESCPT